MRCSKTRVERNVVVGYDPPSGDDALVVARADCVGESLESGSCDCGNCSDKRRFVGNLYACIYVNIDCGKLIMCRGTLTCDVKIVISWLKEIGVSLDLDTIFGL